MRGTHRWVLALCNEINEIYRRVAVNSNFQFISFPTRSRISVQMDAAAASSSSAAAAAAASSGGSDSQLQIIGIAVGVIFGIAIIAGIVMYMRSRSSKDDDDESNDHKEPHFASAEILRDVVVGLSDGLTVPFALTAGLASLGSSKTVVLGGISELVAGAISMGLGGYLAGKSEIESFDAEEAREWNEVHMVPEQEEDEIVELFEEYGMSRKDIEPLLQRFRSDPQLWVEFMMKYELGLEKPESSRLWISALTVGGSYFMGGLVPLFPYLVIPSAQTAFFVSIGATLVVLLIFGYVKALAVGVTNRWKSAIEMMIVGASAAGAAFGVAKALPQPQMT
ncbi:hypothetical protein HDU83_001310 [Entophlyctis luteolus]|nr:hypothetical protein HDU83_001310 [Entophlyctis luteolus]